MNRQMKLIAHEVIINDVVCGFDDIFQMKSDEYVMNPDTCSCTIVWKTKLDKMHI